MASENGHSPEAADYIGSLADELAKLAKSHNPGALAYILDMARLPIKSAVSVTGVAPV